jgi:protein-ribulosamine 3-kinase
MLTASFLRGLETQLGKKLKQKLHIRRVSPISGGSINHAARVDTTFGTFFLKANDAFQFPLMFDKEANGLKLLKSTNLFTIPEVILISEEEGLSFLILRHIESKLMIKDFWERFGTSLAKLHRLTSPRFGFNEDNYIGSLVQSNKEHNRWVDFFVEERLEKQLRLAINSGKLNNSDSDLFRRVFINYENMISNEPPTMLHGDLWSGNFMTGTDGEPCLIDPAVYYGHREMDISMSKLFGGFDDKFYEAYNIEYTLALGFEERIDIHNLYPLLVHVNLFGGQYISQVRGILKKFS